MSNLLMVFYFSKIVHSLDCDDAKNVRKRLVENGVKILFKSD